ncbi:hypothetical protein DY000_02040046 [Brassica cretica]|uniref:Uncharacterized protein n=1 Tax=Brassica cretica TaxID=69181 RepID=A0ABQ7BPZ6_BRACR|nr:hypothetical protein DY000_02040046 [Brassica cretica]
MDDLEESGDFGAFWNLLNTELHRCVRCLAMAGDLPTFRLSLSFYTRYSFELAFHCRRFEVNHHPVAEVMPVLLKSGQSASREKVVEEMKNCRSTVHPCHRSTCNQLTEPELCWIRYLGEYDSWSRNLVAQAIASIDVCSLFTCESWNKDLDI